MLPGVSEPLLQTSAEPHDSRHSSTGFYANGVSNRPQGYDKNSPIVHTGPEDPRPFTSQVFALTLAYVGVHLVLLTARMAIRTTRPRRASPTGNITRHVVTLTNNAKLKPNPSTRIHARSPNNSSMAEVLTLCISLLPLDVLYVLSHLCAKERYLLPSRSLFQVLAVFFRRSFHLILHHLLDPLLPKLAQNLSRHSPKLDVHCIGHLGPFRY